MKFLKFSSLVRFVFTGGFSLAIAYLLYYCCEGTADNTVLDFFKSVGGIEITIAIATMYFVGVIFFGLRMSLSRSKMLSKFYDRISLGWRRILCPYIELDVNHLCDELKENRKEGRRIPDWIYMVKQPSELLDRVVEYMFKGAGEDADDEMRYMNETATTLIFILYLAILLLFVRFIIALIGSSLVSEPTNILILLTVLIGLVLILSVIAKTFAIRFLMKLGHMENVCKGVKDISKLSFSPNEYPTAFVLIRTTRKEGNNKKQEQQETEVTGEKDKNEYKYIENALRSVATQDYPNVRIIILEDVESINKSKTENLEIKTIIEVIRKEFGQEWGRLISYNQDKCEGPAGAAFRIRELFLMVAKERDIAIMLDDDDTLRHDGAISDIVLHMCMNQAEICLCSFETIEDMHLNICNNGGKTHNDIVKRLEEKAEMFDTSKVMVSSIGWTKAYTKKQVEKYNNNILGTQIQVVKNVEVEEKKIEREKAADIYRELKRYEDFPDILVLASSNKGGAPPRITGVSIPTHNYSKHTGGITTIPDICDFKNARPKFLVLTLKLAFAAEENRIDTWSISNENVQNIIMYVLFKTIQISNIMMSHRRKYEEAGNDKWYKFKDATKDSFVDNLYEALRQMTEEEQTRIKEVLNKYTVEYEYITPKGEVIPQPLPSNDLKELMRTALTTFYKRNRADIDIKDLKWYIEKHSKE